MKTIQNIPQQMQISPQGVIHAKEAVGLKLRLIADSRGIAVENVGTTSRQKSQTLQQVHQGLFQPTPEDVTVVVQEDGSTCDGDTTDTDEDTRSDADEVPPPFEKLMLT